MDVELVWWVPQRDKTNEDSCPRNDTRPSTWNVHPFPLSIKLEEVVKK